MRTRLSVQNTLGPTRYGYALEQVLRSGSRRHLDIGCRDGSWLEELGRRGVTDLHGVDVNEDAILAAKKLRPELDLRYVPDTRRLPYADRSFDSVSLMDVLEHVDEPYQHGLLDEIHRVLDARGTFVITAPQQHVFSFLDTGNFKFRFKRLHRWWYTRKHGASMYHYKYVENPFGLVGDVMASKAWHEHFSRARLEALLREHGFDVVDVDGAGLFYRTLDIPRLAIPIRRVQQMIRRIQLWDSARFESKDIYVTCRRNAADAVA